ncbi:MAG: right-handed parallel beta-helix repeat-containing protein [Planctomycetota bacterium]
MKLYPTSLSRRCAVVLYLLMIGGGHIAPAADAQAAPEVLAAELPYDIAEVGLTGRTLIAAPDGKPNAAGTEADPLTLQAAADQTQPGDTVLARGGVYTNGGNTFAALNIKNTGTADHWIRYANYPGENPVIRFDSLRGIRVEGACYLVIEGFEVDGQNEKVDRQAAFEHAENFTGQDHSQTRFFGVGIRLSTTEPPSDPAPEGWERTNPHHIIVRGNKVRHTSGGGIASARGDYLLIENNEIFKTSFYTPWGGSGISIWQSANHDDRQDVYRTVIKDNVCYQNDNRVKFWMMKAFSDGNGIILDALHNSQENIIGDGYTTAYNGRILVVNNLCFLNGGRGVNVFESDNIDVIHNTLHFNAQRDNIENEIELGRTKNTRIFNNIINVASGKQAIGGYQASEITTDFNLIHGSRRPHANFPYGEHVVTADPECVRAPQRAPSGNTPMPMDKVSFELKTNSPARAAGTAEHTFPVDHDGNPRDAESAPDLGAFVAEAE